MAGQEKLKVSSKDNDTLTSLSGSSSEAPDNGYYRASTADYRTIVGNMTIVEHAYALISFARQEGMEPTELFARILNSGNLLVSEQRFGDPADISCIDDEIKDLVF